MKKKRHTRNISFRKFIGCFIYLNKTYLSNLNIGLINLFLKFNLCFVGVGGHYGVNKLTVTSDKLFAHLVTWLQFIFYCHTKLTPCKNEKKT